MSGKNTNKKEMKTNVMRILDQKKVKYDHYCYADTDAVSGVEVAHVLNQNPAQVFKTLVTVGKSGNHFVFVIPCERELNLKKAAKAAGQLCRMTSFRWQSEKRDKMHAWL